MSRTYRRKNETHLINLELFAETRFHYFNKQCLSFEKVYNKTKARFSGDKIRYNAPKDFRDEMNKELRAKNKMLLVKSIKEDTDVEFIPHKRSMNWYYF